MTFVDKNNAEDKFQIRSQEHILLHCGETLKNIIEGDGTNPEITLKLPSLECKRILQLYFLTGQVNA